LRTVCAFSKQPPRAPPDLCADNLLTFLETFWKPPDVGFLVVSRNSTALLFLPGYRTKSVWGNATYRQWLSKSFIIAEEKHTCLIYNSLFSQQIPYFSSTPIVEKRRLQHNRILTPVTTWSTEPVTENRILRLHIRLSPVFEICIL